MEAYKWRGQAYDRSGDRERSLADLSYYISRNPADPEGYSMRADAETAGYNYEQSLRDYNKALELAPRSAAAYVGRGLAYIGLERYRRAASDFETALDHAPGYIDALINLGLANMLADRPNRARQIFLKVLETETDPGWSNRLREWIAALPDAQDAEWARDTDKDSDISEETPGRDVPAVRQPLPASPVQRQTSGFSTTSTERAPSAGTVGVTRLPGLSGTWETTYLGARITMQVNQSGSAVSGVMRIAGLSGKTDEYHFHGTMGYDGTIRAEHHSGHVFQGRLTQDRRLVGVLNTRFGRSINVDFSPNGNTASEASSAVDSKPHSLDKRPPGTSSSP